MSNRPHDVCPDCDGVSRRRFLATTAAASAAIAGLPRILSAAEPAVAAAPAASKPETLVAQLYKTLTEDQKKRICFPFDHKLRSEVNNNWFIVERFRVGEDMNADQQAMVMDIFKGLHSEEYADAVLKQVQNDNNCKNLEDTSVALFGEPGTGKFEFVLTARHTTRRCDGDSVEGHAFGGPIFYGHASGGFNEKPDHPGNIYWYQAKRANELFQALDGKQREIALQAGGARKEDKTNTVALAGDKGKIVGLPSTEMSKDQKDLLRKVMADVLAPFRKQDIEESMKLIEANGGFDKIRVAYFKNMDIGGDGVWDVWQLESPHMLWYFRGSPHVHTWVNIKAPA